MAFPYAGSAGVASVVYEQCSDLARKYFKGAVNAPDNYRLLGGEVRQLNKTLEILCDHGTRGHIPSSTRVNLDEAYQAARESIKELNDFLQNFRGIEDADSKWWKEFPEKLRFAGESQQVERLKVKFSSHVQALEVLRSDIRQ